MTLELLLAGPILRRTDRHGVHVWIATSAKVDATLSIFGAGGAPIGSDSAPHGSVRGVQLGDRLWVYLLKATPADAFEFPSSQVLAYDLSVDGNTLNALGLLGDGGINYPGSSLPGFVIPMPDAPILHGSCRKPHAHERSANLQEDALATADTWLATHSSQADQRPAALFMTGDQIYADDVAGPMLDRLMALAPVLTGWRERVPGKGVRGETTLDPLDLDLYGRKTQMSAGRTGFTSGSMENHLISFGEFAAMYLTVWGGIPLEMRDWDQVKNHVFYQFSNNLEDSFVPNFQSYDTEQRYHRQLDVLRVFAKTLPRVRRLLANVPTYMIADDHDVTDDWYIDQAWRDTVLGKARGRRVIANAQAAYWAFQAWGNDPDTFSDEFIATLSVYLSGKQESQATASDFEAALINRPGNWGFFAPTQPPVVVLDTRTCRVNHGKQDGPAQLMDAASLDWLKTTWETLPDGDTADGRPLILVSPTPVMGFDPVEFLQRKANKVLPVASLDFESWSADPIGLQALLTQLAAMNPVWCLCLSGDVHYSFTKRQNKGLPFLFWQCTSSPLMNNPTAKYVLRCLSTAEYKKCKADYITPDTRPHELISVDNNLGAIFFIQGRPNLQSLFLSGGGGEATLNYQLI